MIRGWRAARRAAALAIAAGLAGGCALATETAASAPASAAEPSAYVALVIDDPAARLLLEKCVSWSPGLTGTDVLHEARVTVTYAQSGLIIALDDQPPNPGPVPPTSDYWSYWHNSGSGWGYAALGPASSFPAAGSVEGWALGDSVAPPLVSFATICPDAGTISSPSPNPSSPHASSSSTSAPTRAPSTRPPSTSSAPQGGGSAAHGQAADSAAAQPTGSATSSASTAAAASGSSLPSAGPADGSDAGGSAAHTSGGASTGGTQPSLVPAAQLSTRKGSSSDVLGAVLGVAAAAALGGVAFWRSRHRPAP